MKKKKVIGHAVNNNKAKSSNKFLVWLKENWWAVLISFGGTFLIGGIAALFTNTDSDWFVNLVKPVFYPPNIVFSIAWTVMYILLSITLYILISKRKGSTATYILFGLNGLLNILWCLIFFTLQNVFFGMLTLVGNFVIASMLYFSVKKDFKKASYLLIPYLLWLAFAFVLNYLIYLLN